MLPNMVYASMCLLLLFSPAFGRRWVQQPDTPNSEEETGAPEFAALVSNTDAETRNSRRRRTRRRRDRRRDRRRRDRRRCAAPKIEYSASTGLCLPPPIAVGRWVFNRSVFGSNDALTIGFGTSVTSASFNAEAQTSLDAMFRSRSAQICFVACAQALNTRLQVETQSRLSASFSSSTVSFSRNSTRNFNASLGTRVYQFQWDVKVGSEIVSVIKEDLYVQTDSPEPPRCFPNENAKGSRNYSRCKDDYYERFNRTDLDGSPQYGERFIQIGRWFMAEFDSRHFSIANIDTKKTALIFRDDGTLHNGPRNDYQAFNRRFGEPTGIQFGEDFIQIGQWRLASLGKYFSIAAARTNKTALILRDDGNVFPGPRNDFQSFSRPSGERKGVESGERFIQIGNWRFADIDGEHFSVAADRSRKTAEIFLADGTIQRGPRNDFQAFSRKAVQ